MRTVTHGLASTYRSRRGCRCDECRKASTERSKGERARRFARLAADPSLAPHGLASTHKNWGCRCEPCVKANSADCRRRRAARRAAG